MFFIFTNDWVHLYGVWHFESFLGSMNLMFQKKTHDSTVTKSCQDTLKPDSLDFSYAYESKECTYLSLAFHQHYSGDNGWLCQSPWRLYLNGAQGAGWFLNYLIFLQGRGVWKESNNKSRHLSDEFIFTYLFAPWHFSLFFIFTLMMHLPQIAALLSLMLLLYLYVFNLISQI